MWFVIGPMFLAFRTFVDIGLLLTAGLLGWAAVRYFELARRGRQFGALIIALGLSVIGAGIGAGVLIAIGVAPSPGLVNQVAVINVIASLFVALGMVLLVFEELTGELRRTNRDLATANEAARRLAITDPLTGCHNRRFFEEIERREMKRHRRYGVPLSVVFIDVDRLKQLNDSAGHERGDDALRAIGAMLRREVRQSDYVIRWGGDEFLLLLTCSLGLAEHKAALLKEAFLQEREVSGLPDRIGLSVGVAAVAPEAENLQGAIRDADALMYRDKLGEGTSLQVR
jgi:diguanylate cyclase (GGDEF)-like protein